jgi:hypothetical protein
VRSEESSFLKLVKGCAELVLVFITIRPYHATGSSDVWKSCTPVVAGFLRGTLDGPELRRPAHLFAFDEPLPTADLPDVLRSVAQALRDRRELIGERLEVNSANSSATAPSVLPDDLGWRSGGIHSFPI